MNGWYDINLDQKGIDKLNGLFSSKPFIIEKNELNEYRVYIDDPERKISSPFCMLSYDLFNMAVYPAIIEKLPEEIQFDIRTKLKMVKGLEAVVSDFNYLLLNFSPQSTKNSQKI